MPNQGISICVTLKNRAGLLNDKLHQLQHQDFDLKKVEICVTDGGSTDELFDILKLWASSFYQIKYAVSDRSVLPFKVLVNPACDYNAQMANQPTFEKIIRTDAEVLFTHRDQLAYIFQELDKDRNTCIWHPSIIVNQREAFAYDPEHPFRTPVGDNVDPATQNRSRDAAPGVAIYRARSAFCIGINKSAFIENRGFDERYALGFAGEDNQLLRWYARNKREVKSKFYVIHQWHEPPVANPEFVRLREEYTKPLLKRMTEENEQANPDDLEGVWTRPEMLRDERVFK